MPKTPTEQFKEIAVSLATLTERLDNLRNQELGQLQKQLDEERAAGRERDRQVSELRQENAVLKQLVQDHIAQYQEWDRRRWSLILALVGAVFTLASGLIVTLAKK
jgi:hypothetical protein